MQYDMMNLSHSLFVPCKTRMVLTPQKWMNAAGSLNLRQGNQLSVLPSLQLQSVSDLQRIVVVLLVPQQFF